MGTGKRYMISFKIAEGQKIGEIFLKFVREFGVEDAVLLDEYDDPNEVLTNLQGQGDDYEADTVERLAIKAGYWWKCTACNQVNLSTEKTCPNCHAERTE